ncbi:glycosyltransferase family 2 protein, partial [Oceaniglobus roseus]|uniref:glycosyltransferase family 2 protein n=1 Tax=Oceaniglobus roseus TaxID=1737570 RepID=UPI000C7F06A7
MTDSRPSVLTVVLNWRTPEMTLRAAAAALADMGDRPGGIVIVDNDSRDGSFERMRAEVARRGWTAGGRVRVLQAGRNGGFGAGNNVGIRAGLPDGTRPDYVYILNSDAFPDPGCIGALVRFMEAHPAAGFAGGHVRGEDGQPHTTLFRFPSIPGAFEMEARTGPVSRLLKRWVVPLPIPQAPQRVGWVAGASLMARRAMLDRIGLFDETFFLYYEETDLCLRAARAGWETWYVPEARVVHVGSVSTGMRTWERVPDYFFASRRHY